MRPRVQVSAAVGEGEKCVVCKTCQLQQVLERPEWVAGGFPIRVISLGLSVDPEGNDPRGLATPESMWPGKYTAVPTVWPRSLDIDRDKHS